MAQRRKGQMIFVLDTNVVSELRKGRPHGAVLEFVAMQSAHDVTIAAVTAGEIQAGIEKTRRTQPAKAEELEQWLIGLCSSITVLPADAAVFRIWAQLMHTRPAHVSNDALIAATALHHGLTVATRNVRDFTPFGVLVTNPFR
jgi:predicted nucleic acid-binding protein